MHSDRLIRHAASALTLFLLVATSAFLAASAIAGCDNAAPPATVSPKPLAVAASSSVESVGAHVNAAHGAVNQAKPLAGEAAQPPLAVASDELEAAKAEIVTLRQNVKDLASAALSKHAELEATLRERDEARGIIAQRDATIGELNERWESSWVGGRLIRTLRWIIFTFAGLLTLGVVLTLIGFLGPGFWTTTAAMIGRLLNLFVPIVGGAINWGADYIWERWLRGRYQRKAQAS